MAAGIVLTVVVTALALVALGRVLQDVEPGQIYESLRRIGPMRIGVAALLTAGCYVALSGYDKIALRSLGRDLGWRRTILGSVAAYALSHNLGFAPVTASYARHRVYSHDGVGIADVARIVVLTGAAFWLGVVFVMGLCLALVPDLISVPGWSLSRPMQSAVGLVIIDVVVVYLLLISKGWTRLGWGRWSVPLPSINDAFKQGGISFLEMGLASAVLWILMPSAGIADYPIVLVAYVTAFVAVLISHAPGGAGVLETVVLLMLPMLPKAEVVSALIAFRIIFHIAPLLVAILILALHRGRKAA